MPKKGFKSTPEILREMTDKKNKDLNIVYYHYFCEELYSNPFLKKYKIIQKMEVKKVFPKPHETIVGKSCVTFIFENCPAASEIISEKIEIPEIDAEWWIEITKWEKKTSTYYEVAYCGFKPFDYWNRQMIFVLKKSTEVCLRNSLGYNVKFNTKLVNPKPAEDKQKSTEFELKDASELQQDEILFKKEFLNIVHDPLNKLNHNFDVKVCNTENDYKLECEVEISHKTVGYEYQIVEKVGITPILKSMNEMLESGKFSDFTFVVSGKEFKVHKNILSLASPVLATMFEIDMEEKKLNCAKVDCAADIFQHLLEFVYSGKLPENFSEVAIDLYEVAHLYQIDSLMKYSLGHVTAKEINEENALELYEFATKFSFDELFDRSWSFIKFKMMKFFKPIDRDPLTVEEIRNFMRETERHEQEIAKLFTKNGSKVGGDIEGEKDLNDDK